MTQTQLIAAVIVVESTRRRAVGAVQLFRAVVFTIGGVVVFSVVHD